MTKRKSKLKAKPQQAASSDQFINPPLEKYKNELQYDAKVWLNERAADEELKEPFDLMINFALICARQVTAILISLRNLKSLCVSGKASFAERWMLCNGLYVLSAVNQRLQNLPDDEWKQWPVTRGSHCFEINGLSTLLALDDVCTGVEDIAFGWIFRWIWSVSGRKVDCDPVSSVIGDAVKDAGISNFIQWSHRFNLNMFMDSDIFPWSGDVRFFNEMISDECDPEVELERVMLELVLEHHEAVANLTKINVQVETGQSELAKPAVRRQLKRRKKKKPAAQRKQSPAMSLPLGLQKWALILGVSVGTVRTWKNDPNSEYHFQPMGANSRKWRLPLNELPAEYLERYKKSVS